jgi:hypothetical protein
VREHERQRASGAGSGGLIGRGTQVHEMDDAAVDLGQEAATTQSAYPDT